MHSIARTAVVVLLALACLQATAEAQKKPRQSRDRNRVNAEELSATPPTTVYQFVRARRGHWLSTRGQTTLTTRSMTDVTTGQAAMGAVSPEIVVYLDDVRYGSQETLRSMRTEDVDSMEFLDSGSATQRFGSGHVHGAILIRRRAR